MGVEEVQVLCHSLSFFHSVRIFNTFCNSFFYCQEEIVGTSQACLRLLNLGNWQETEMQKYFGGLLWGFCFVFSFFFFSPDLHKAYSWLLVFNVMIQSLWKGTFVDNSTYFALSSLSRKWESCLLKLPIYLFWHFSLLIPERLPFLIWHHGTQSFVTRNTPCYPMPHYWFLWANTAAVLVFSC